MEYLLYCIIFIALIVFYKTFNWSDILHGSNSFFMRSLAYANIVAIFFFGLVTASPVIVLALVGIGTIASGEILQGIMLLVVDIVIGIIGTFVVIKVLKKIIGLINGDVGKKDIEETEKIKKNKIEPVEKKKNEKGYDVFDDEW